MLRYTVPLIGDGLTPETAFRPDLPDGFDYVMQGMASDEQGRPVKTEIDCLVSHKTLTDDAVTLTLRAYNTKIVPKLAVKL